MPDSLNLDLQTWQPVNLNDSERSRGYIALTSLNFSTNLKTDKRIEMTLSSFKVKVRLSKVISFFKWKLHWKT